MAFDRKDGNAMFDLPTHFEIAMIEAPWAVRALGLASQSPTPARTSNTSLCRRLRAHHAPHTASFLFGVWSPGRPRKASRLDLGCVDVSGGPGRPGGPPDSTWGATSTVWKCLEALHHCDPKGLGAEPFRVCTTLHGFQTRFGASGGVSRPWTTLGDSWRPPDSIWGVWRCVEALRDLGGPPDSIWKV